MNSTVPSMSVGAKIFGIRKAVDVPVLEHHPKVYQITDILLLLLDPKNKKKHSKRLLAFILPESSKIMHLIPSKCTM